MGSVLRITREVTRGTKRTREVAYAIGSLTRERLPAEAALKVVRGHFGIENGLHWTRDMDFDEDRCRVRSGAAPQALAAVRNAALALLHLARVKSVARALRQLSLFPDRAVALGKGAAP